MIQIKNLFKHYTMGSEKTIVLEDVTLSIAQGEFLCILGASGCGKSTLLNVVGGLDDEIEGELLLEAENAKNFREQDWNRYRKKSVGFIFQNFNLIEHMSAQENIELAMKFNGSTPEYQKERAICLLELVGLKEKSTYLPSQLSGGQKQRVAVARALANQPGMILADEPTGALDSKAACEIMELLHRLNKEQHVTVILVTHNRELAKEADRVVTMADGKISSISGKESEALPTLQKQEGRRQSTGSMSLRSALQVGVKNILLKKKRSLLTVFGTAVGIAGMVLMLGVGNGADAKVQHELRVFVGDETVFVEKKEPSQVFTGDDVAILNEIPGVELVLANYVFQTKYYYNKVSVDGLLEALGPRASATSYEKSLADMGALPATDKGDEILLSSPIASKLLGKKEPLQALIGKRITVVSSLNLGSGMTYQVEREVTVTGIMDSGAIGGGAFLPCDTAREMAEESVKSVTLGKGAKVRIAEEADYEQTVEQIRSLGYEATTNAEGFAGINGMLLALKVFLAFVAGVSIFVSAIMIKIVLHTNVVERTKEIGIMSAIGAGKRDIRRIFVIEAGILGGLSGLAGIGMGQISGMLLNLILRTHFEGMNFDLYLIDGKTILLSWAISVVVAALAGRKPAKAAAKISPAQALRFE